jgi:hypothetical protein
VYLICAAHRLNIDRHGSRLAGAQACAVDSGIRDKRPAATADRFEIDAAV